MNQELCKTVVEHRKDLVPALFTERQVNLVQKYVLQQKLTPGEQSYFYSAIRRKMEALNSVRQEYYVTGTNMIPERVEQAEHILRGLEYKKAFISGSFLFKKEYGDIDIFIVGKNRKQYQKGKKQFIFLTWKDLSKPIFFSSTTYSVSTFSLLDVKPDLRRTAFEEILLSYELSINEILDNDDQKTLRYLINYYHINVHKRIPNSFELDAELSSLISFSQRERILKINLMAKEIFLSAFSPRYLSSKMRQFIQTIKKLKEQYPPENLDVYLQLAEVVQHGCRVAEAKT